MSFFTHFHKLSSFRIKVGTPVIFKFTRYKSETLLDTPEELPTSEPSTPQISYTFSDSHLQVEPPLRSCRIVAVVWGAGKNTSGGSTTIHCKWLKNGSEVYSKYISVSNNYYYTVGYSYASPNDGDVLELKLWADASGVNWDWKGYDADVEYLDFGFDYYFLQVIESETHPAFELGNPYIVNYQQYKWYKQYSVSNGKWYWDSVYIESYRSNLIIFSPHPTYGHGKLYACSGGQSHSDTSTAYRPFIRGNTVYKKVAVLPVLGMQW